MEIPLIIQILGSPMLCHYPFVNQGWAKWMLLYVNYDRKWATDLGLKWASWRAYKDDKQT